MEEADPDGPARLRGDRPPAPLETDPATGIPPKPGTIAGTPRHRPNGTAWPD